MSLLDADIHSAHPSVIIDADAMFSEDISYFGYPSFRRSSLSRLSSSRGNTPPPPALPLQLFQTLRTPSLFSVHVSSRPLPGAVASWVGALGHQKDGGSNPSSALQPLMGP